MRIVKKALSLAVSASMMLGTVTPTLAANQVMPQKTRSQLGYEQLQEGLYETMNGLELGPLKQEETAVKFNITEGGEYTVTYHVESGAITEKVDITLNVGKKFDSSGVLTTDQNRIALEVSVGDPATEFQEHLFPYQGKWGSKQVGSFKKNLAKDDALIAAGESEKQASILVGGFLNVRFKVIKDEFYVWTNKIQKGNITEFKLTHNGITEKLNILNGLKNFEVLPVHLYENNGNLDSKKTVDYPAEVPGEKPGVSVSIEKPKKVGVSGKFEYLSEVELAKISAALVLWIEGETDNDNKQIRLDFSLGQNSPITGDIVTGNKVTSQDSSNIKLFLAKDISDLGVVSNKVVEWGALERSSLLGGTLELYGEPIEGIYNSVYALEDKGYTYMQFTARRSGVSEAYIAIRPYQVEANAKYVVYQKYLSASDNWNKLVEYSYDKNDSTQEIIIPINSTVEQYYKVEVHVEGQSKPIVSQEMKYNPKNEAAPPTVSRIAEVSNLFAVTEGKEQVIGFDLTWSVPKKEDFLKYLEKGDLYYELFLHSPEEANKTYSKIFKASLNNNNEVEVSVYAGTAGAEMPVTSRYDDKKNTITMENVTLKKLGESGWEQIVMPENYLEKDFYPEEGSKADDFQVIHNLNYQIPNTFYISMRTVYSVNGERNSYSLESSKESISISDTKQIIPVPDRIESFENKSIVGGDGESVIAETLKFSNIDISRYVKYQLNPLDWYLTLLDTDTAGKYQGDYEILLYTDNVDSDMQPITSSQSVIDGTIVLTEDEKESLREGKSIVITIPDQVMTGYGDVSVTIGNLDENQVYYIKIREHLVAKKQISDKDISEREIYSDFSKEYSFTTGTEILPPNIEELVPPAPESITIVGQPSNTVAVLEWMETVFTKPNKDSKVYYELVRSLDKKLPKEQLEKDVESLANETIKVFSTKDEFIKSYNVAAGVWEEISPQQPSEELKLEDPTLRPNTVYYYYVRTVHETQGKKLKSDWVYTAVTTNPVNKPIDLKVESVDDYNYDETNEVVVSFLAQIPEGSKVPEEYDFEIAVLGEEDEEYSLDYPIEFLGMKASTEVNGYSKVVYKITGLQYGEKYNIKVRIVDKTIEVEGDQYPKSLYSDVISFRTEFDEEENDKDNAYKDWLEKYDQEIKKMQTQEYWIVSEDKGVDARKYRKEYVASNILLGESINIVLEEGDSKSEVYLPFELVDNLNKKNLSIVVKKGTTSMEIRPNTITGFNESIKEAEELIGYRNIEDFYVKFSFRLQDAPSRVGGQKTISSLISVRAEIQMIDNLDKGIDQEILKYLDGVSQKERENLEEELRDYLDKYGVSTEKLNDLVMESVGLVRDKLNEKSSQVISRKFNKILEVDQLEKSLLISSELQALIVSGMASRNKTWETVATYTTGTISFMEAMYSGDYVFVGELIGGSLVPQIPQDQLNVINKYGLSEILRVDTVGLQQALTKQQVYNSIARILGAPKGVDAYQYLKIKGFDGISLNQAKIDTQADVVFQVMQLYERIYYKPITNTVIKDRGKVSNLSSFQIKQRPYVLAAVELKVVHPVNNRVEPQVHVTTQEFLGMLSKVVPK